MNINIKVTVRGRSCRPRLDTDLRQLTHFRLVDVAQPKRAGLLFICEWTDTLDFGLRLDIQKMLKRWSLLIGTQSRRPIHRHCHVFGKAFQPIKRLHYFTRKGHASNDSESILTFWSRFGRALKLF